MPNLAGVVCDGTTDNTAALQAILDDPLDNVLDFRNSGGNCLFTGTLNFTYPKHIISLPNGPKLIFRPPGATAIDALHFDAGCGATGTLLERIGLDYRAAAGATGRACIARVRESGISFEGCDLNGNKDLQSTAQINGIWSDETFRDLNIIGGSLHDFVEYPIFGYTIDPANDGNSNVYIARVVIKRFSATQAAISLSGGLGAGRRIFDCDIDASDGTSSAGIQVFGPSASARCEDVQICGNNVRSRINGESGGECISIRNANGARITDNYTQAGTEGIATGETTNTVIEGNTLVGPRDYCIETGGTRSLVCSSNICNGYNQTATGIIADAAGDTYANIVGNDIVGCLSDGIVATSETFGALIANNRITAQYKPSGSFTAIKANVSHCVAIVGNLIDGNGHSGVSSTGISCSTSPSGVVDGNFLRNLSVAISVPSSLLQGTNGTSNIG